MTVSVVIPCFNSGPFIAEAINSLLQQSVSNIEIIVVDDGSTDNSSDVIRGFQEVTLISQANRGVSTARNNGAKAASGRFLVFLDADDRLHSGAIEAHLRAFSDDKNLVLTFGTCDVVSSTGAVIYSHRQSPSPYTFWDILLGITPNPSQCMIRREAFDRVGRFNENITYGEDWDCFLRLSQEGLVYCHGVVVADYRKHDAQSTRYPSKILLSMLNIIDAHASNIQSNAENTRKFNAAKTHYRRFFGKWIPAETLRYLRSGRLRAAASSVAVFVRFMPDSFHGLPDVVRGVGRKRESMR